MIMMKEETERVNNKKAGTKMKKKKGNDREGKQHYELNHLKSENEEAGEDGNKFQGIELH